MAALAHAAEEAIVAGSDDPVGKRRIANLDRAWRDKASSFSRVFGSSSKQEVMLDRTEYEEFCMSLMCQTDHAQLLGEAQRWSMLPISRVFARLSMQMERVAGVLGKRVRTVSEPNGVRLPNTGLQELWASMVHVVRNSADHGFEGPELREGTGKDPIGTFTLKAETTDDDLVLVAGDDGIGIDWERVRTRAKEMGLPSDTHEQLADALFFSGLSTRKNVDANSGRGAGTSALKAAVEHLSGSIHVMSTRGQGTTFTIRIPLASLATLGLVS